MQNSTKTCIRCRQTKPIAEFHNDKKEPDGKRAYCRDCISEMRTSRRSSVEDLPGETWKEIHGFEGLYSVSNMGRVKQHRRKHYVCLMKPEKNYAGYLRVKLSKHGVRKHYAVHRLVAEAFIHNENGLETVNHKNLNKSDNRAVNLEWLSTGDNIRHARDSGLNNRKPVAQYSPSGELVRVWESAWEAQITGGHISADISACCRGKYKTHHGYVWKFINK